MIYAITYIDHVGKRQLMFDFGRALIFNGSKLTNENFELIQERLCDLLDGSPKVKGIFKKKISRKDYPQETIALWRRQLQTLEIVPYQIFFGEKQ